MIDSIIFTREDWMAVAHRLLPKCDQALLDEMWVDVERLDAKYRAKKMVAELWKKAGM